MVSKALKYGSLRTADILQGNEGPKHGKQDVLRRHPWAPDVKVALDRKAGSISSGILLA